mmetsp:Transcript_53098/g.164539  ORF Transcript_53098/g.164539 Transcript_53098/m.164539 type:complete len:212 (-) Transcript_53098:430-1065(-)
MRHQSLGGALLLPPERPPHVALGPLPLGGAARPEVGPEAGDVHAVLFQGGEEATPKPQDVLRFYCKAVPLGDGRAEQLAADVLPRRRPRQHEVFVISPEVIQLLCQRNHAVGHIRCTARSAMGVALLADVEVAVARTPVTPHIHQDALAVVADDDRPCRAEGPVSRARPMPQRVPRRAGGHAWHHRAVEERPQLPLPASLQQLVDVRCGTM